MSQRLSDLILSSNAWVGQPYHVRVVWMGLLAMADEDGVVCGPKKALANAIDVTLEDLEDALKVLTSPDPEAPSQEFEGRRVRQLGPNSWHVVDVATLRALIAAEHRRLYMRQYMKRYREAIRLSANARAPHKP